MADIKKPAGSKTIIDVAHPGKSAPAANSKSVIISNRPILKDPMMVGEAPADAEDAANGSPPAKTAPELKIDTGKPSLAEPLLEPETPAEAAKPSKAPTIAELAETAVPGKPSEQPKPDKPEKPAADTPNTPEPDKSEDEEKADKAPDPEPADEDGETPPTKAEDDEKLELEATEQAKHQAAVEKLAESKKYYLPINAIEKRRSRRFVVLGIILSLLLIVAWADVALDAGLVKAGGIKPLTHFFSN